MRPELASVSEVTVSFENSKEQGKTTRKKNGILQWIDTEFCSAVQCFWNVSTLLLKREWWMVRGDSSVDKVYLYTLKTYLWTSCKTLSVKVSIWNFSAGEAEKGRSISEAHWIKNDLEKIHRLTSNIHELSYTHWPTPTLASTYRIHTPQYTQMKQREQRSIGGPAFSPFQDLWMEEELFSLCLLGVFVTSSDNVGKHQLLHGPYTEHLCSSRS